MKTRIIFVSLFLLLPVLFYSCADTVEPGETGNIFYQVPGCFSKPAVSDSCFSYVFSNKLYVEFCVYGNCCPDSNRFIFAQYVIGDTINLTVKDIEQKLCRCVCLYTLHSETTNLVLNSYQYCIYQEDIRPENLLYSERVFRDIR